ncbi:hypothetical protein HDU93_007236 [Gonapodya sp. JEL0774]|nr:hypothetical protein HDU93_007236 [Gonapodya sp. JEL0774]
MRATSAIASTLLLAAAAVGVSAQNGTNTFTAVLQWDPVTSDEQCKSLITSNSTWKYDGHIDVIYFGGPATAQQSIIDAAVNITDGGAVYNATGPLWNASAVEACCIVSSDQYSTVGSKFRCLPSTGSVSNFIPLNVTLYAGDVTATPPPPSPPTSAPPPASSPPAGAPPSSTGTESNFYVSVEWDAAAVDAQCKAVVVGSKWKYDGHADIIYSSGPSGAEQTIVDSALNVTDGQSILNVTGAVWNASNVDACCIVTPDQFQTVGNKLRCIPTDGNSTSLFSINITITAGDSFPGYGTGNPSPPPPFPGYGTGNPAPPPAGSGSVPPPISGGTAYPRTQCPSSVLTYAGIDSTGAQLWGYLDSKADANGVWWRHCTTCADGSKPAMTVPWTSGQCGATIPPPPGSSTGQECPSGTTLTYSGYYQDGTTKKWGYAGDGSGGVWWKYCSVCKSGSPVKETVAYTSGTC